MGYTANVALRHIIYVTHICTMCKSKNDLLVLQCVADFLKNQINIQGTFAFAESQKILRS